MKNKLKAWMIVAAVMFLTAGPAFSQWEKGQVNVRFSVPEIAIVDIEPGGGDKIVFSVEPATEPGGEPVVKQKRGGSIWLNYSSALRPGGPTRSINAQIAQGSVPEGLSLILEASAPSVFGSANQGQSTGRVVVTEQPKPIISGIGNCFTGDGINKGHELKYSLEITDFSKIETIKAEEFTILYTITDN